MVKLPFTSSPIGQAVCSQVQLAQEDTTQDNRQPSTAANVRNDRGAIEVETFPGSIGNDVRSTSAQAAWSRDNTPLKASSDHRRILIMDDDEILLNMIGVMLEHLEYKADFALNGQEAIEKYRDALHAGEPFEAVIMDLIIPVGMGGKEAVQHLLQLDPQAKVIVSSGYVHNSVIKDYSQYGFKDVLIKPYRISDLKKVLDRL